MVDRMTGLEEEWLDQINVLHCESCDTQYTLSLSDQYTDEYHDEWLRRTADLRGKVNAEHALQHPTRTFVHYGSFIDEHR